MNLPVNLICRSVNPIQYVYFTPTYSYGQMFLTNFRPDINPNTTFSLQALDGGSNSQEPGEAGVEANLDTQIAVGMATGIPVTFISVGLNNTDGDLDGFLDFIHFLLSQEHIPRVLTTSYGQNEEDVSAALAQYLSSNRIQHHLIMFIQVAMQCVCTARCPRSIYPLLVW